MSLLLNSVTIAASGLDVVNGVLPAGLPPLPLADLSTLPWAALIAIGGSFLIGPAVIFIIFQSAHRREKLWHETARVALEKGQPLPPMPAEAAPSPVKAGPPNDIRTGLVLVALGAGLYLFLDTFVARNLGYVGAIPGFIGLALLFYGLLSAVFKRNAPPVDRS
jgi:Domain of unknown function (DUF6249)